MLGDVGIHTRKAVTAIPVPIASAEAMMFVCCMIQQAASAKRGRDR